MYKLKQILTEIEYQESLNSEIDYFIIERLNTSLLSYYKDIITSFEYLNRQKKDSIRKKLLK